MSDNLFNLREEHIALLCSGRTGVQWQDDETGAPEIDPKRPYGNSDVAGDVCEILMWPETPNNLKSAMDLHRETAKALAVILSTKSFEPGEYERKPYTDLWVKR